MQSVKKNWQIIIIVILSVLVHLLPFFEFSHPLGYDTGFYRRFLIENSTPYTNVPGLGQDAIVPKFILKLFSLLPTDIALYGSYIAIYCVITILFYKISRKYLGNKASILVTFLFTISPVAYTGYWFMLYKNAIGILLLLSLILLIENKSPWAYLFSTLLLFSHQTSSIIFIIGIIFYFFIQKNSKVYSALLGALSISIYIFLHQKNITTSFQNLPTAQFITWFSFLALSYPVLMLASAGIKHWYKKTSGTFLFSFTLISFLYILFNLPFHERIFIFADIFLIIIAGFGIEYLITRAETSHKNIFKAILTGIFLIASVIFIHRVIYLKPLISTNGLNELYLIDKNIGPGSNIITSTSLAPWVEGFSHAHVIAPGMFNDTHNEKEWASYWNSNSTIEKEIFLQSFPKPLFIFIQPEFSSAFAPTSCQTVITNFLSNIDCRPTEK